MIIVDSKDHFFGFCPFRMDNISIFSGPRRKYSCVLKVLELSVPRADIVITLFKMGQHSDVPKMGSTWVYSKWDHSPLGDANDTLVDLREPKFRQRPL